MGSGVERGGEGRWELEVIMETRRPCPCRRGKSVSLSMKSKALRAQFLLKPLISLSLAGNRKPFEVLRTVVKPWDEGISFPLERTAGKIVAFSYLKLL